MSKATNMPKVLEGGLLLTGNDIILIGFALHSLRKRKRHADDKALLIAVHELLKKLEPLRDKIADNHLKDLKDELAAAVEAIGKTKN